MGYLINPAGRMVAIDNQKEFEEWLRTPGFTKPTEQQEHDWIKLKYAEREAERVGENKEKGVYLCSVSQGGKDGYSIAGGGIIKEFRKLGGTIDTHYNGQKISILFHNPYSILRMESPYRIIYTMFESDKIPDDWKDYLDAADLVLVPSNWCASVFMKAGVEAKVLPLGYDDKLFTYKPRINKRQARNTFNFLHYNAFNIRKGFSEVWRAFNAEFEKTEPVKLILKTTLEQIPLPITTTEYPNVEILRGKTSDAELVDLCHNSDCFLFPSRGEGFGMTPLEAMATGMCAIVPNAHGITQYFHKDYMYEVKVKEKCPALYSRYKNQDVGEMVVCDVDDLRKQMRYVYEHQDEAIDMGKKASEYVKQWTYEKTAKQLKVIIDDIMEKPLPEKPLRNALALEQIT